MSGSDRIIAKLPPLPRSPERPAPVFKLPLMAQRALQVEEIEWPVGSGRVARYSDAERRLVRALLESGSPTRLDEVLLIHDAKVELDAVLREPYPGETW